MLSTTLYFVLLLDALVSVHGKIPHCVIGASSRSLALKESIWSKPARPTDSTGFMDVIQIWYKRYYHIVILGTHVV
ncbi:unnamed protein product [Albugo candida]|uniref:Secreted protein n=1 Tax=Albugo candida TaxID=65357 RepID=A0A024GVL6_9STRA|nr:unnamed protein product [Albugo candida]|eukprot:CCI50910.1 unnamed protein product [Albugo candida]